MENTTETNNKKTNIRHKALTVIGTVLCIVLIPVLIVNCTLIIRSYTNSDEVPSIGGYCPMIVLTDSMYDVIESGDLIICKTIAAEDVREQDIISFFDPSSNTQSVVTHRVTEVTADQNGNIAWRTKGDANNIADQMLVPAENLVGIYTGTRIAGAGNFVIFLSTTWGLIIFVALPLVLLIVYDIIRRKSYEKSKQKDTDALLAELEALRAEKAGKNGVDADEKKE